MRRGGVTYHISSIYPQAKFTLVDLNKEAITLAKQNLQHLRATFLVEDMNKLSLPDDEYDRVFCWQTLSWTDSELEKSLAELVRICKPGGLIYCSSLFNLEHEVDLKTEVFDWTRPSCVQSGHCFTYKTFSYRTLQTILEKLVKHFTVHKFDMPIDLTFKPKGLGTYTVRLIDGSRLQISAGMLMNWGILEIEK